MASARVGRPTGLVALNEPPPSREHRVTVAPSVWYDPETGHLTDGLFDRRLVPDLMLPDPPTWRWPYACHRHGHVWAASIWCAECGASWRAHGPDGHLMEEAPFTGRPWRRSEVVTAVGGSR